MLLRKRDQDILGLDIPMNNPEIVEMVQPGGKLL